MGVVYDRTAGGVGARLGQGRALVPTKHIRDKSTFLGVNGASRCPYARVVGVSFLLPDTRFRGLPRKESCIRSVRAFHLQGFLHSAVDCAVVPPRPEALLAHLYVLSDKVVQRSNHVLELHWRQAKHALVG